MSKIRLNHIDWENYDELDELYDDSMEMIHNKKEKMENLKKTTMMETFTNHKGCLPEGERVIVISEELKKNEITITDPFGTEWVVPSEYVSLSS